MDKGGVAAVVKGSDSGGGISIPKGILVGVKLPVRLSIEHLLGSRLIGLTRLILESSDLSIGLLNGLT